MSVDANLLLVAAVAGPLLLLLACALPQLRRVMPVLLPFAPLPALAAAVLVPAGLSVALGSSRLPLALAQDAPGRMLLGVCALLWIAAGVYARTWVRGTQHPERFVACWLAALSGCLGCFVVADLVSLYAMLALLTLGATGLVIHEQTPRAWRAGGIYFGLALAAESVLLAGLVLLAQALPGDSLLIRDATAALPLLPQRDLILALLLGGLGLKAGLVPLHVWMPLAYPAAPVPAASVLSGAVVKVSVIGLIRFLPLDYALPGWGLALTVIGFAGAYYGVLVGITQANPKAVLAYSSVSQMGVIAAVLGMGLGAGDGTAGVAAAYYAAHHVLVKGALFLAVGVMAASAVGRRGWILVPAVLLSLSLGGLPLTGGALAKYAVKAQLDVGVVGLLAALSALGTTLLMLHFVRCLGACASDATSARAAPGLMLPWLAAALAALLVPAWLYPALGAGTIAETFAPAALWAASWPVLIGAAAAWLLGRVSGRLPRIPEGDLAVLLDQGGGALRAIGQRCVRLDERLRVWPVATTAMLALVILIGFLLTR